MGGNYNQLEGFIETSGYSLSRSYCNLDVTYDASDRVTSAVYWKDTLKTVPLESFTITYDGSDVPSIDGVEYREMRFDPWRGRMVLDSTTPETLTTSQTIRGRCNHIFSTTTFELLSNTKNSPVIWPSGAEIISVVSTNAADSSGGIGIRTITINGISGAGSDISDTVTTNGITPVLSVLSFLRINSIISLTSGTNEVAVGNITFTNASLDVLDTISAGSSRSASLKYTIPTTQQLVLKGLRLNVDDFSEYEIKLLIYPRNPSIPPYSYIDTVAGKQSDLHVFPGEIIIGAETDICVVIKKRSGTTGNSLVTGNLLGTQSLVV